MTIEYKSGAYSLDILKEMTETQLFDFYEQLVIDGKEIGIEETRLKPISKLPLVEAMKRCVAVYSSIVARKGNEELSVEETPKMKEKMVDKKRKNGINVDIMIDVNVDANPKRGASKIRFDFYRNGLTLGEYIEAVGNKTLAIADFKYDLAKGFIKIHQKKENAA